MRVGQVARVYDILEDMQVNEAAVLEALKVVKDPDLHRDIVTLGFIKNLVVIPVVYRPSVAAVSTKLHVLLSGWDSYIWNFQDWYADA